MGRNWRASPTTWPPPGCAGSTSASTRWGRLPQVLEGIAAATAAGLHVKINMVALRGINDDEIDAMLRWTGERGHDLVLIETMPMGQVDDDRVDRYLPLAGVRGDLATNWTLTDLPDSTGGPARYVRVVETGQRLGFITPLTHNFCDSCNRVRLTATGRLYLCLGQDDAVDFRDALRNGVDATGLDALIDRALLKKPRGHAVGIDRARPIPAVGRHMSLTGG